MTSIKHLIPLAALAALAACGGDSTGPGGGGAGSGSLSFTYSGGGGAGGTFQAAGAVPTNGTLGNWAGGGRLNDAEGTTVLLTAVAKSGAHYDMMSIEVDGAAAGIYSLDAECETMCAFATIAFGVESMTDMGDRACTLTGGQVVVTTLSATEAKGTFTGTGVCITDGVSGEPFQVIGGTFDLLRGCGTWWSPCRPQPSALRLHAPGRP